MEFKSEREIIVSQLLQTANRLNMGSSSSTSTGLADKYVSTHGLLGHSDYCFAWLDNAVCPQMFLNNSCCFKHEYPPQWSLQQRDRHKSMEKYMDCLFLNANIDTMFEESDEEDEDEDDDDDDDNDYNNLEENSCVYSSTECRMYESSQAVPRANISLGRFEKFHSLQSLDTHYVDIHVISDYESSLDNSDLDSDNNC